MLAVFLTFYWGLTKLGTWWFLAIKGRISGHVFISVKLREGKRKMTLSGMGQDLLMSDWLPNNIPINKKELKKQIC